MTARTILLVEDSKDQARIMQRWLALTGFQVQVANDGREGLELARRGEFDLVIAGIDLPFYRGVEIIQWSKAEHPSRPVILLTAASFLSDKEDRLSRIADAFLVKPLTRARLCEVATRLYDASKVVRSDATSLREFADGRVTGDALEASGSARTVRVPVGYVLGICDALTARPRAG